MMEKFMEALRENGYEVEEITKVSNGVELKGIRLSKGNTVAPVIYPTEDMSVENVLDYAENAILNTPTLDINSLANPDFVKENAVLCIQKKGKEEIVKEDYLDLELYVRVQLSDEMSYKVKSSMNIEGVLDAAKENCKGTFKVTSLCEIIAQLQDVPVEEVKKEMGNVEQFVITNERKQNAASCLYYPSIFKEICRDTHSEGCYILPSSIHESIVVLDKDGTMEKKLYFDSMVVEVNAQEVKEEEQLADHCYYYSLSTNEITY